MALGRGVPAGVDPVREVQRVATLSDLVRGHREIWSARVRLDDFGLELLVERGADTLRRVHHSDNLSIGVKDDVVAVGSGSCKFLLCVLFMIVDRVLVLAMMSAFCLY